MPATLSRRAAVYAVSRVTTGLINKDILYEDEYSNRVLYEVFEGIDPNSKKSGYDKLTPQDKMLVTRIVYGTLERLLTIDYIISKFSKMKIDKIEKRTMAALQIGIYQILFMSKIPKHAAVNESTEIVSKGSKGFVNAILRNIARTFSNSDDDFNVFLTELISEKTSELRILSLKYSCPEWIISLWTSYLGIKRTISILENSLEVPPIYIRLNTYAYKTSDVLNAMKDEGLNVTPVKTINNLKNCYKINHFGSLERTKAFKNGMFHIQDISPQILCSQVALNALLVYDMCAAPGGKSFTIAEDIGRTHGKICAFDVNKERSLRIVDGAHRLLLDKKISVYQNDATNNHPNIGNNADYVLCDVPCSGLGVIRRHPEKKYVVPPKNSRLPQKQLAILEGGAECVCPGGVLIYSTCTLNYGENEAVTKEFANRHPEFTPKALNIGFNSNVIDINSTLSHRKSTSESILTPELVGGDGFFISMFIRKKVRS